MVIDFGVSIAVLPLQFQTVSLDIREQSWEEISKFLMSCSNTLRKVFVGLLTVHPGLAFRLRSRRSIWR